MDITKEKSNELLHQKMMLEYAWNWFSYHAQQRLTTFNFFLVIISAIGFLFIQLLDRSNGIGIGIQNALICCISGGSLIIISKLFYKIEHRNLELVNCGRAALDRLEKEIGIYDDEVDEKFSVRLRDKKRRYLPKGLTQKFTHTQVFKEIFIGLQCIGGLIIVIGLVVLVLALIKKGVLCV